MRFHFGISFRWNTIKKFLFPFLIGLLAYFGFSSGIFENLHLPFLTLTKVHAYSNYDTSYTIEPFDWDTYLSSVNCGGEILKDVIDDFIDNYDNTYFEAFIYSDYSQDLTDGNYGSRFYIYLIPKNHNRNALYWYGDDSHNFGFNYEFTSTYNLNSSAVYYYLNTSGCSANSPTITNTTTWNDLLNAMNTGNGNYDLVYNSISLIDRYNYNIWDLPKWASSLKKINSLNFNNTDSFTIENVILPYYSSEPLYFNTNVSSSGYYLKNLIINGNTYTYGDEIPTYVNLPSPTPPEPTFIEYKDYLGTIYSNFSPNDYSNFEVKLNFDTYDLNALEYTQNLTYYIQCYGRINHGNYYSYEKFPMCSVAMDFGTGVELDSNHNKLVFNDLLIADSNGNIINNFSNYDKLFIYIDFNYNDPSLNKTISNMSLISTQNVYYEDDFRGPIYENFDSLGSYFKMLISTSKNSKSSLYAKSISSNITTNDFINTQYYNTTTLKEYEVNGYLSDSWKNFNVNNYNSISLMLFQQINSLNSGILNPSIHLVIFQDIVISINNISNDTFYFVNSSGNIESNVIEVDYASSSNQSFDLSYYFYEFNNYLDSISSQCLTLHNITQDFYDSTPEFFRVSIFIIFILFCISFLYREIRR